VTVSRSLPAYPPLSTSRNRSHNRRCASAFVPRTVSRRCRRLPLPSRGNSTRRDHVALARPRLIWPFVDPRSGHSPGDPGMLQALVTTIRRAVTRTDGSRPEAISSYAALRPMPRIRCTPRTLSTSRASTKRFVLFIVSTPENETPRRAGSRAIFPRIIMRAKVRRFLLRLLYRKQGPTLCTALPGFFAFRACHTCAHVSCRGGCGLTVIEGFS
jgi:hypothetical protein